MSRIVPPGIRRLLGGVLLAGVIGVVVLPVPAHGLGAPRDCHHQPGAPTSSNPGATAPSGCDHGLGAACAAMLDCTSPAPALTTGPEQQLAQSLVITLRSRAIPIAHGRLALGPPTPPPNS